MRIGYLGPAGTYTQQAVELFTARLGRHNIEKVPLGSIDEVFDAVDSKTVEGGVVPFRNSIAGDYGETIRRMKERETFTRKYSHDLDICLALGIHPDASRSDITEIRSKDTALRECELYLGANYPSAERIAVESTAKAMRDIHDGRLLNVAAVGSIMGMTMYGLQILDSNIGDKQDNVTTFIYVVRKKGISRR
ncbi:MAG: prephenate dehydratase domain-containing protein [Nanoarchaeota archaeon]|nr:prephenate dehydratase domain-containing protein [Nanoarchaeota archaeon]